MALRLITDENFIQKSKNGEIKFDAVVAQTYPDPRKSVVLPGCMMRSYGAVTDMLRPALGQLEVGDARPVKGYSPYEYFVLSVTPYPYIDKKSITYETLKKCYHNAIECAYDLGIGNVVLTPHYAGIYFGGDIYKADMVYAAALDAADEFFTENGENAFDVYFMIREKVFLSESLGPITKEKLMKIGNEHSADAGEWLDYIMENTNLTEKAMRLSAKWSDRRETGQKREYEAESEKLRNEVNDLRKEQQQFIQDNPHLKDEVYRRERFVEYIREQVGEGRKYSQSKFADMSDIDTANLSRIINGTKLEVQKETAIKIALALRLPLEDFKLCIFCAGYSFPADETDIAIEQCIKENIYNYGEVEEYIGRSLSRRRKKTADR